MNNGDFVLNLFLTFYHLTSLIVSLCFRRLQIRRKN